MRITHSLKNIGIGIASAVILTLLGFLSRKVFLDALGAEYLGINALLFSVLTMLSLVEGGIGASIVYHLYKPLADNDRPKIIALVQLYRKAYRYLSVAILLLSLLLFPFLKYIVGENSSLPMTVVGVAYLLFVAKNIVSYLNAHKISLIQADQREYVIARVTLVFQIVSTVAKIAVLLITANFILYLVIELLIFAIQMLYSGVIVGKRYSYIHTKDRYEVEASEKKKLIKNMKALFFHSIGAFVVFSTDNLLIASFVSVAAVGLYSNYTMIIGQLNALLAPMLNGVGASVGNMIASESKEKTFSIFKVLYFINFWLYSVSVIFLFVLVEPFINWWLGEGYLLGTTVFLIILLNFYLMGMRASILTFKTKAGIFVQDQYMPLLEAAVNLVASILLARWLGIAGVFIGTTISTLSIVFWNAPRLVYKTVFQLPLRHYFIAYGTYVTVMLGAGWITYMTCLLVEGNGFFSLVAKGIICLIVPNLLYLLIFYKTDEMNYVRQLVGRMVSSWHVKLKTKRVV